MAYTFEPSLTNSVFVPDQLIAGSDDIVTDTVTLASGLTLVRGTLIGQQTSGTYGTVSSASTTTGGANTGNATIGGITAGALVRLGTYRVNMTTATAFNVLDPAGELVGTGTAGTAFVSGQITLTVTTGGTAMVANDGFSVVVEEIPGAGNGYWVQATATAADGSQEAKNWAILAEDTNTSSTGTNAATACPVYIGGEFDSNYLTLGTGLTGTGIKQALRQAGSALFIKTGALVNSIV